MTNSRDLRAFSATVSEIFSTSDFKHRAVRLQQEVVPFLKELVGRGSEEVQRTQGASVHHLSTWVESPDFRPSSLKTTFKTSYTRAVAGIGGRGSSTLWPIFSTDSGALRFPPFRLVLEADQGGLRVALETLVYHRRHAHWREVLRAVLGTRGVASRAVQQRSGLRAIQAVPLPTESVPPLARIESRTESLPLTEAKLNRLVDSFVALYPAYSELERRASEGAEDALARFPEELPPSATIPEGGRKLLVVNAYERSSRARRLCIKRHGTRCSICGVDLEEIYGPVARGLIHVHHLVPLASIGDSYEVDPVRDLVPVCPNCHAVVHRHYPEPFAVEYVRGLLRRESLD